MKYFLNLLVPLFFTAHGLAQVWTNHGAVVNILPGAVISSGSLQNTTGTITNSGTVSLSKDFTNSVIVNGPGNFTIGGNWVNTGTFIPGAGTVILNGTGAQSLTPGTFNNLTINKISGTASLTGNTPIDGNLAITSGTLNISTFLSNRTSPGGSFTMGNGAVLFVNGVNNFPSAFSTTAMDSTSTVTYNGTMDQSIAGVNYGNLVLSNSGTAKTLGTPAAVGGNITIDSGVNFIDTSNVKIAGTIYKAGTFTASNGGIEMNGSAAQTIPSATFSGNVIRSLTINNPAGVTLGGALSLTNVLTISNGSLASDGYLTLKSTATGTARVAPITSAATTPVSGNVIEERYVQGRRKYRLITSAVTTSTSSSLSAGQEALSIWGNWQNGGVNTTPNIGSLITGGTSADGFDPGTANASLYTYDDVNRKFVGYTSANGKNTKYTPLKAGIAYYMFVYGDRLNSVGATSPHNTVLVSTGTLKTGNQVYNTTSAIPLSGVTGLFTLLGNPFASPIDWATIPKTDLDNTYWGWDPNLASTGGYITVTTSGAVTLEAPYSGSTGLNQYIQPGQGFFVKTNGPSPLLTIREQDKVSNFNGVAFRAAGKADMVSLLAINLQYASGGTKILADGVLEAFGDAFSNNVGPEDAAKMANAAESVSILRDATSLSIDAKQFPVMDDTLFLNLSRLTKPQYTLQIFAKQMEDIGIEAYLEDRYLGSLQPLSLADTNNIVFNVTPGIPASADINRFRVIFFTDIVLPVKFRSIKATPKNEEINVEWTIADESGIQQYVVERSVDGAHFEDAAIITTGGNNTGESYHWLDVHPVAGNNYYRVRAVLTDGKFLFSKVALAKMTEAGPSIKIFPNPIKNNQVNIRLDGMAKGTYTLLLYNSRGEQIMTRMLDHPGGSGNHVIRLDKNLPAGIYYVQVGNEWNKYRQTIFIEN